MTALVLGPIAPKAAHAQPPSAAPEIGRFGLWRELPAIAPRPGPQIGLRAPHFDLGLSLGRQLERDGSIGFSLAAQLHLGVRDGVNLTAGYDYLLPRQALSGRAVGPHGAIGVSLTPRLALTGEGRLLGDGGGLVTIGLSHRLQAGGATWFLSGGLGFVVRRGDAGCGGGGQLRVNGDWCAAPAAVMGIEGRF